jgi:probable blue pigment (indigoidine) exporter
MKSRAALAFVAVGILWGSAWIPNSVLLRNMPSMRAGALRFAIAAASVGLVALVLRLRRGAALAISRSTFRVALVLGATGLALPYALTAWAAGQVSSGTVAVLFAFMPLASLLLSGEIASGSIPGLVIGIGGVVFLVANGVSVSSSQVGGIALITCSVVLGALSLNYAKAHLRRPDLLVSVAIQFAFAAVLLGVFSAATERSHPAFWTREALVSLLVLGIVVSGLTLPIVYWLLFGLRSWQVAALQWTATFVAVAESAWLLRARPSLEMWAGAALVTGATLWLLRPNFTHPETVTLQITNHLSRTPAASESEVRSK